MAPISLVDLGIDPNRSKKALLWFQSRCRD